MTRTTTTTTTNLRYEPIIIIIWEWRSTSSDRFLHFTFHKLNGIDGLAVVQPKTMHRHRRSYSDGEKRRKETWKSTKNQTTLMQTTMENCSSEFSIRNERSVFFFIRNRYGRRKREFRRKMNVEANVQWHRSFSVGIFPTWDRKREGLARFQSLLLHYVSCHIKENRTTTKNIQCAFDKFELSAKWCEANEPMDETNSESWAKWEAEGVRLKHCDQNESWLHLEIENYQWIVSWYEST